MSVEGFNGVFLRGVLHQLELVVVQNGNEYYHQTLNHIPFYPTRTPWPPPPYQHHHKAAPSKNFEIILLYSDKYSYGVVF